MNEMVKTGTDALAAYGRKAGGVTGTFMKFDKGSYYAGKDDKMIAIGTRMIADFSEMLIGWKCWKEGKLVEDRTFLLAEGGEPAARPTLPDQDQELWELKTDPKTGRREPKDPWQFGNSLPLYDPKAGEQYILNVQSKSGIRSLAQTVGKFARESRRHAGMMPLVELMVDSFPTDDYGRIPFPKLNIVEWVAAPGEDQPQLTLPTQAATRF